MVITNLRDNYISQNYYFLRTWKEICIVTSFVVLNLYIPGKSKLIEYIHDISNLNKHDFWYFQEKKKKNKIIWQHCKVKRLEARIGCVFQVCFRILHETETCHKLSVIGRMLKILGESYYSFRELFFQFPFLIKICSLFSTKKTNDAHSLHNSVTLN